MKLFDLPPYYLVSFLRDWISAAENAILNSACCEMKERKKLLHLLSISMSKNVLFESSDCLPMVQLVFESKLRSSMLMKDVIFTRRISAKVQCGIFQQYSEEGCLEHICCVDKSTSIGQLMFPVINNCTENVNEFFMWHDNQPNGVRVSEEHLTGHCVSCETEGAEYVGNMINNKSCGFGTYQWAKGMIYVGEWKDDKMHGHGIFRFANGAVYEGEYKDNHRHGHGIFKFKGDFIDAEWKEDKINGCGVFHHSSGDVYEGEFENSNQHGCGMMKYANGNVYEGRFQFNARCGYGVMHYASGNKYVGEWLNGNRHGYGEYTFGDGVCYKGKFVDDALLLDKN